MKAESTIPPCLPPYILSALWQSLKSSRKEIVVVEATKGGTAPEWKWEDQEFMEQTGIT